MDQSLKARLIGATVLVVLAVLLIPELLTGRKLSAPTAEAPAARDTRTFTIELGRSGGTMSNPAPAPASSAPVPAPTPAGSASAAASPDLVPQGPGGIATVPDDAPAPADPAMPAATQPDRTPSAATEPVAAAPTPVAVQPVEPVQEGTDDASCRCQDVDILAHPGMITEDAVLNARENGIFLELSYRGGHCLGNGHVTRLARKHGAMLLVDSDAHNIGDHMTPADALGVGRNSGLTAAEAERVVFENPDILLKRLK